MQDFMKMFGQIKEAQTKIQEIQQQLGHLQATGEAGAGLVKATVNGHKKLIQVSIDPSIIQPNDQQLMQDLVVAATNLALEKIEIQIKEKIQTNTDGMLEGFPLDLLL